MSGRQPSELAVLLRYRRESSKWMDSGFAFFIPSDNLLIDSIYFCLTESALISAFLLCFIFFIFLL